MFSETLLDHFRNPRNAGDLPGATASVEVSNPICGDVLRLSVLVEGGRIKQARFLCRGCTTAIACGSALTELLLGCSVSEISAISAETIANALGGLPSAAYHGAQLASDALAALSAKLSSP